MNRAFYAAFESGDPEQLASTWEHSDRVLCTHPGWPTLRGWSTVFESWRAIFRSGSLQFVLTDETVHVQGDVGWVSLDENLIGVEGASGTVAALNVFARGDDGGWRMVAHHGSSVVARLG